MRVEGNGKGCLREKERSRELGGAAGGGCENLQASPTPRALSFSYCSPRVGAWDGRVHPGLGVEICPAALPEGEREQGWE